MGSICPVALCWSWVASTWGWSLRCEFDPWLVFAGKASKATDPGRDLHWLNQDCAGRKHLTYRNAERPEGCWWLHGVVKAAKVGLQPRGGHVPVPAAVSCLAAWLSKTLSFIDLFPRPYFPRRRINNAFAQSKATRSKAMPFGIPNPACEISLGKLDFLTSLANKP